MSPTVLFLQHDHVSPPSVVGERFAQRGFRIEPVQVMPHDRHDETAPPTALPDPSRFDVIVTMGARWSVYDFDRIGSWVHPEMEMLRTAQTAGIPVLGICFGGQLLAQAHAGSVTASPTPEMGWHHVDSDDPEMIHPGPWFQWHSDCWTIPPGATEIARNAAASQAFTLGRSMGVQFHPELDLAMLQGWLAAGGRRDLEARGHDESELLRHTEAEQTAARMRTFRLVDGFLDRIATAPLPHRFLGARTASYSVLQALSPLKEQT